MVEKIVIEVPGWAEDRNIYVMAGVELLAHRLRGGPLMVKTSRCRMCGECCKDIGDNPFPPAIDGQCEFLTKCVGDNDEWECGLRSARPFACSIGVADKKRFPECTEKFEVSE